MDVALGTGRRWAFSLDIEKLFTTVFDDNQEVQLSPIEYGLGLAHRF
jgi:hypothetical protein